MKKYILLILFIFIALIGCSENNDKSTNIKNAMLLNNSSNALLVDDGDYYVMGGDMLLDKRDPNHQQIIDMLLSNSNQISKGFDIDNNPKTLGAVLRFGVMQWPNGKVPYYFADDLSDSQKESIREAMAIINSYCNVDFYESSPGIYRLKIGEKIKDPEVGGRSTIGYCMFPRVRLNGYSTDTIIHEICHNLGLLHEHQRSDRDNYITILWENINIFYFYDFLKIPDEVFGITVSKKYGNYDYNSIMHYSDDAFKKQYCDDCKTIDGHGHEIISPDTLSFGDIYTLKELYGPAARPIIAVKENSSYIYLYALIEDGVCIFESEEIPEYKLLNFTIENLGAENLDLTGSPKVTLSNNINFNIIEQPLKDKLAPGESTTFTVEFRPVTKPDSIRPDSTKHYYNEATIESSDANRSPFTIKFDICTIVK